MKLAIITVAAVVLTGCGSTPPLLFSGSGTYYHFKNLKEEGCTVTISKKGDAQSTANAAVMITSTDEKCSVAGGLTDSLLTGKDGILSDLIASAIDKAFKAKGI